MRRCDRIMGPHYDSKSPSDYERVIMSAKGKLQSEVCAVQCRDGNHAIVEK